MAVHQLEGEPKILREKDKRPARQIIQDSNGEKKNHSHFALVWKERSCERWYLVAGLGASLLVLSSSMDRLTHTFGGSIGVD